MGRRGPYDYGRWVIVLPILTPFGFVCLDKRAIRAWLGADR